MDFKKCERCGSFFVSLDNVCCNCVQKDKFDKSKLQSFLEEDNFTTTSVESIAVSTGIATRNLNRYLNKEDILSF